MYLDAIFCSVGRLHIRCLTCSDNVAVACGPHCCSGRSPRCAGQAKNANHQRVRCKRPPAERATSAGADANHCDVAASV